MAVAVVVVRRNNDGKVYRVDIATAVADRKLETFTQQQLEELFEAVDPDGKHTHSAHVPLRRLRGSLPLVA